MLPASSLNSPSGCLSDEAAALDRDSISGHSGLVAKEAEAARSSPLELSVAR